jgi:epoxyqueuosine reductase
MGQEQRHTLQPDKWYNNWGLVTYCQYVCHPDPEERKRRHKLVINSGVVIQNPDGSLEAVSPDEEEKRLAAMSPELRALYV